MPDRKNVEALGVSSEASEVDTLRAELEEQRAELATMTRLVMRVLAERETASGPTLQEVEAKAPPLEPIENERARILAAWDAEPRVSIFIAPDENDRRARDAFIGRGVAHAGFPPRTFSVNSVQLSVAVGKAVSVPQSIAALHEYMLDPWTARGIIEPVTFDVIEARMSRA